MKLQSHNNAKLHQDSKNRVQVNTFDVFYYLLRGMFLYYLFRYQQGLVEGY
jgi:hypothetical protein